MSEGFQIALYGLIVLAIVVTPFVLWSRRARRRRAERKDEGLPPQPF
jgi:hypothetical protein